MIITRMVWLLFLMMSAMTCITTHAVVLNDPYAHDGNKNIYHASFSGAPKTLDPARSYTTDESVFVYQIYESPLQYHYLKRPYQLIPQTADSMPEAQYFDKDNKLLAGDPDASLVKYTVYTIKIKPGIFYQDHPAFARGKDNQLLYHHLTPSEIDKLHFISNFPQKATRELTAEDYLYEIKRLADPKVGSPIYGVMKDHLVGLSQCREDIRKIREKMPPAAFLDLRKVTLPNAREIDRYTYQIEVHGKYPQFLYWLAMSFFAPIPWEADQFYAQKGMKEANLSFDWEPVGTGAYYLAENNPNYRMILQKNPHYHPDTYPQDGEVEDISSGILKDAGKKLPFIDTILFTLEKESIPRWNKFLQGYFDISGVSSDSFDQVIEVDMLGHAQLTPEMKAKGIRLRTFVEPGVFYMGFNMLDPLVGGYTEDKKKLRKAISIAVDFEEYIAIFLNGAGVAAQGPIPPGIFGFHEADFNNEIYQKVHDQIRRKSIFYAKQLLAEAGYPGGINPKTKKPLIIHYDVAISGGTEESAQFDWLAKQFSKLGLALHIRTSDYNRFQEKLSKGNTELFFFGWSADYPDPENFLFCLYGPNSKAKYEGENAVNYKNDEFDKYFEQMQHMTNSDARDKIIEKMLKIIRNDSPWIWGYFPRSYIISQPWNRVGKPNVIANNTIKYARIDFEMRDKLQRAWNQAVFWPLGLIALICFIFILPAIIQYYRKEYRP